LVKSKFPLGLLETFLFCLVVSRVFAVNSDEAQAAISRAESKMGLAHKSVLEAEKAGANVSSLLFKLNNGLMLLSRAHMQNRTGNFSEAVNFANQCFESLNGVEIEANKSRDSAVIERNQKMLISVVGLGFAVCAVLYVGVFGWRFFKGRYYKRVLKMKLGVQASDSR